jgi:hypothetical protein
MTRIFHSAKQIVIAVLVVALILFLFALAYSML